MHQKYRTSISSSRTTKEQIERAQTKQKCDARTSSDFERVREKFVSVHEKVNDVRDGAV
jgi:hypothetical protein